MSGAIQPDNAAQPASLAASLGRAELALEPVVPFGSPLVTKLRALRDRLEHDRLQIAVVGQFKRGKSTFINALVGAPVLPTGIVPLTAVATFIAWRSEPLIRVQYKDGTPTEEFAVHEVYAIRDRLYSFVAEAANPENHLNIERVELFYPADLLGDGTVIIDTPGIGSTLRHNTETALHVLPECDVALFVVSAEPPITEVEIDYLRRLKEKAARIFFILNKVDQLPADDRRALVEFMQKVLAERSLGDAVGEIFCVSARDGLEAKQAGNGQDLAGSGIAGLEDHLRCELASKKARWLDDAVRINAIGVLTQASTEINLRERVLRMPIVELAAKSETFREALRDIEEQRRTVCDILAGDHRRLRDALDSCIVALRKEIAASLPRVIDAGLTDVAAANWRAASQRVLSVTLEDSFERAGRRVVGMFAADADAAVLACQSRIDSLVARVRRAAAEIFDIALEARSGKESFELGEEPYWVTEPTASTLIPDTNRLIERLFPATLRRSRLRARMIGQADELIVRNGENLRWAIVRGLDETFRKTTVRFEERLDEAIMATRDVINQALARRQDRSFAVQPELDRLATAAVAFAKLRGELAGDGQHEASLHADMPTGA
jgi:GTP-binding protein EngB required for normal cell division